MLVLEQGIDGSVDLERVLLGPLALEGVRGWHGRMLTHAGAGCNGPYLALRQQLLQRIGAATHIGLTQ